MTQKDQRKRICKVSASSEEEIASFKPEVATGLRTRERRSGRTSESVSIQDQRGTGPELGK